MSGRQRYIRAASDGMIFREDFRTVQSVQDNGGIETGNGLANGKYRPTTSGRIEYGAEADRIAKLSTYTIVARVNLTAHTHAYRILLDVRVGTAGATRLQIGLVDNSTDLFWYSGGAVVLPGANYAPGASTVVWSYSGTGITFYQNGAILGAPTVVAISTLNPTGCKMFIGNNIVAPTPILPFSNWIDSVRIYNRAWNAQEVADDFARCVRGMA